MPKSTNEYKLFKSDMALLEKANRIASGLVAALPEFHPLVDAAVDANCGLAAIIAAGPVIDLTAPDLKALAPAAQHPNSADQRQEACCTASRKKYLDESYNQEQI